MLASRPQFDDLMDGLTFGVISGVAYACFDTLVRHWDLLTGGLQEQDPGLWVSLVFLEGFVKPLVMGTATGLACAEFSGLGRGYDGFTPRYVRAVLWRCWRTSPTRRGRTSSPSSAAPPSACC